MEQQVCASFGSSLNIKRTSNGCSFDIYTLSIHRSFFRFLAIFLVKLDIRKFFDSIDQDILLNLIKKKIKDKDAVCLIKQIIKSQNQGLPLGNVTSQLFANIYLNELDQFIKHKLKIKFYLRYCDDFVVLSKNKAELLNFIKSINNFLENNLNLELHSDKIIIRKYHQGIDFLGYVVLPHYRVLRTKTKKRILRKIKKKKQDLQSGLITKELFNQTLQSYFGVLRHCEGWRIKGMIIEKYL
ncbi:MAG: RNA-directed DNA polymerase [bacterium]